MHEYTCTWDLTLYCESLGCKRLLVIEQDQAAIVFKALNYHGEHTQHDIPTQSQYTDTRCTSPVFLL